MSDDYYNLNGDPVKKDSNPNGTGTDSPYGQNPYGQNPYEQNPYEQTSSGQNPYEQNPSGQNPYGQNSSGQNPYNYGQNPYNNYSQYPNTGMPQKQGPNALAVTAFILSILSPLFCCCSTYGIVVSLIASIAAIILAILSKQKKPFHGLAIAALIIGVIFAVISAFLIICVVIVFSNPILMEQFEDIYEDMYKNILQQNGYQMDLFRILPF